MLTFLFCESGQRVSNGYNELYDVISQLDWYLYPLGLQQMLPIIIFTTQQSVEMLGFGRCPCTRESFKDVRFIIISSRNRKIHKINIDFLSGREWRIFVLYDVT